MAKKLHMYAQLHYYCSVHTQLTLVYKQVRYLVSDTNSYKGMDINQKV